MGPEASFAIEARGLMRRFGDFVAVAGIDLDVRQGEVFGLLGANGAGKTTAIRMLCGTLPPTAGEIRIADVDMVRRARAARGRIGYVTQRFALYGDLTVSENLRLQAGLYGLDRARAESRIEWAMKRLDLARAAPQRAGSLPLGHEPTSGIDPLARGELWELVYELAEGGVGVLITTHYMDEALFCDRLALMHAGHIVATDSPQGLLARGLDTPILEVVAPRTADWLPLLAEDGDILEVVPRAGRLRARLRSGRDAAEAARALAARAATAGVALDRVELAAPDFEDVVVGLLGRESAP